MQRGQSTVEYCALVLLALVVACSLVRFHTPVESLAADVARAVTAHRRAHHVIRHPAHGRGHRRRPADRRCFCPIGPQARPMSDD
jgi:hypothetical protein